MHGLKPVLSIISRLQLYKPKKAPGTNAASPFSIPLTSWLEEYARSLQETPAVRDRNSPPAFVHTGSSFLHCIASMEGRDARPPFDLAEMVPPYFGLLSGLLGLCRVKVSAK
jgi:hypothetical protein